MHGRPTTLTRDENFHYVRVAHDSAHARHSPQFPPQNDRLQSVHTSATSSQQFSQYSSPHCSHMTLSQHLAQKV